MVCSKKAHFIRRSQMFGLLFGRRQKEDVQPQKPARPQPQKIAVSENIRETLAEYAAVSAQVGYKPAQVRQEELKLFLADNSIPAYDREQVHQYLVVQAEEHRVEYKWIPLREQDKQWNCVPLGTTDAKFNDFFTHGNIRTNWGPYAQIVPLSVMETIAKINKAFPDAHFYVSDISHYPDPFLAVAIAQCQLIVIDFWSEPGFRPA